jgi:16S rRNA (guanine1207-N2)-methyltransferase
MPKLTSRELDLYQKKSVDLWIGGQSLTFDVSQTLFSSHKVDVGTKHLLKALLDVQLRSGCKVLDLGCGYGPIGLTLKKLHPDTQLQMVDRDALAVAFARHNTELNEVTDVAAYGSLGYDAVVTRDFELIVSNIPGKAGESVIRALLRDARYHLTDAGSVAIVVVSPLEEMVLDVLASPDIEILDHQQFGGHTVFRYRFSAAPPTGQRPSSEARDVYDREAVTFVLDELTFSMETATGLPEFDTLSYGTEFMVKVLLSRELKGQQRLVVFNPGQGHLAVVAWQTLQPEKITLIDRDLLSLRYTRRNLINSGCPEERIVTHHQVGLDGPEASADLILGMLREDEGTEATEYAVVQAARQLAPKGKLFIGAGSTPITRILKSKEVGRHLRTIKRRRSKGNSVAILLRT